MKKLLKIIGFILVIIITYITILKLFPKEINRFPFLVLLFITDLYLWNSFKTWRKRQKLVVRSVLAFLYWSPLIMLSILIVSQVLKFEMIADEKASILIKGFIFSAYAAKLLPIMSLILTDLIRGGKLLVNLKHKKTKEKLSGTPISRNLFLRQIGLVSGGLLFSGLIVGMIKWVYDFKIHHHSIRFPNLPNGFKGFRIVQISDLHLGSWYEKKRP
jgi:predicted MPP superfamily phosphohydrolase